MTQYKEAGLDKQDSAEIKNYTRTPNMLIYNYHDTLSPQEKWLYVCLKHMCGKKGTRHLSLRYISEQTGISTGALSTSKNKKGEINLGMIRHLHDAGLIHAEIKKPGKGNPQYHITITDIWALNQAFFSKTRSDFGQDEDEEPEPVRNSDEPVQISDRSVQISDEPVRNSGNTNIRYKTNNKITTQEESSSVDANASRRALIANDLKEIIDETLEEVRTASGKIRAIRPGVQLPAEEEETKKRETTIPSKHTSSLAEPVPPERSQVPAASSPPASMQQAAPGLRITHAPTSRAVTQERMPEPAPPTDKQLKQQQTRRENELWAIVERKLETTFSRSQRKSAKNKRGMERLLEDQIADEKIELALDRLTEWEINNFDLERFHELLPGKTAKHRPSQQNGKALPTAPKKNTDVNDYSITALLKRQAAAQG